MAVKKNKAYWESVRAESEYAESLDQIATNSEGFAFNVSMKHVRTKIVFEYAVISWSHFKPETEIGGIICGGTKEGWDFVQCRNLEDAIRSSKQAASWKKSKIEIVKVEKFPKGTYNGEISKIAREIA